MTEYIEIGLQLATAVGVWALVRETRKPAPVAPVVEFEDEPADEFADVDAPLLTPEAVVEDLIPDVPEPEPEPQPAPPPPARPRLPQLVQVYEKRDGGWHFKKWVREGKPDYFDALNTPGWALRTSKDADLELGVQE